MLSEHLIVQKRVEELEKKLSEKIKLPDKRVIEGTDRWLYEALGYNYAIDEVIRINKGEV